MKIGRGSEDGVEVGPLIDGTQRDKVAELVTDAVGKGAKVLTGGEAEGGRGYFYEPTVLTDISDDAQLLQEEIFGPVAPVTALHDRGGGDRRGQRHRVRPRRLRLHPRPEPRVPRRGGAGDRHARPQPGRRLQRRRAVRRREGSRASAARAATRASRSTSRPSTSRWRSDMASTQSELKDLQRPLKAGYREEPGTARITLTAKGGEGDTGVASCSVDLGRAIYAAEAHVGVGRRRHGRLLGRPAARRPGRVRPAHVPDGRDGDGARRPLGERHRRRRPRSPRDARPRPRGRRGVRRDPAEVRGRRARRQRRGPRRPCSRRPSATAPCCRR